METNVLGKLGSMLGLPPTAKLERTGLDKPRLGQNQPMPDLPALPPPGDGRGSKSAAEDTAPTPPQDDRFELSAKAQRVLDAEAGDPLSQIPEAYRAAFDAAGPETALTRHGPAGRVTQIFLDRFFEGAGDPDVLSFRANVEKLLDTMRTGLQDVELDKLTLANNRDPDRAVFTLMSAGGNRMRFDMRSQPEPPEDTLSIRYLNRQSGDYALSMVKRTVTTEDGTPRLEVEVTEVARRLVHGKLQKAPEHAETRVFPFHRPPPPAAAEQPSADQATAGQAAGDQAPDAAKPGALDERAEPRRVAEEVVAGDARPAAVRAA